LHQPPARDEGPLGKVHATTQRHILAVASRLGAARQLSACSPFPSITSTTYSAIASEEVAAGDGALRTAVTGPRRSIRKSSTRVPSASRAWARTPAPARTTSALPIAGM